MTSEAKTILVVDDEPLVLNMVKAVLHRKGYKVLSAANGAEALHIARQRGLPIHMLLADVVMPEMKGPELADSLIEHNPHLRVLFMSGYTSGEVFRHGALRRGFRWIKKPFMPGELLEEVRRTLDLPVPVRHA